MGFTFTSEQEQLRAAVRRFLSATSTSADVRRLMESAEGYDPVAWARMADQLGLQGLAVPEEYGGSGSGPEELGIVLEEMGRVLHVSPFFATVALAGQALAAAPDETAKKQWLPGIADGSLTATLALPDDGGSWAASPVATSGKGGVTVSGTVGFVPDGDTADLVLVVAHGDSGAGLYAVEGTATGLTRTRLQTLDPTRRLARLELDAVTATPVSGSGDASGYLDHVRDLVSVALAAEQVGVAQRCLDMAVEYAKVRVQFGRPIGSFQAIKHKCADMLLEVESSRSAVYSATSLVGAGGPEASIAASLAQAYCSEAAAHAAAENVQVHGGIGYTWEHDAHLYLKRAKSSELLFGSPATHRSRLADLVGI